MKKCSGPGVPFLSLILAGSCLLYGQSVQLHRAVRPFSAPTRVLAMMVSHESLKPSAVGTEQIRQLMDGTAAIFDSASNRTFKLETVIVPEPVLLPGDCGDYSLKKIQELYAAANRQVLEKYGSQMDPSTFQALIYFFPTDTNAEPFGMGQWNSRFGFRYKPAVVNLGVGGTPLRPEAVAHEFGHAFLTYGHAASADPKTGEVLRWAGDPYDVMGYGLNRSLHNPSHLGFAYRYYWGWVADGEVTTVTRPGTHRLDPGKALLTVTSRNTPVWLELIKAEQAYAGEAGGVLVRLDRANKGGIYHATLDMTPETSFQADLHMKPGQSIVFEGRRITYVKSIPNPASKTPSAEMRIEAEGTWTVSENDSTSTGDKPIYDARVFTCDDQGFLTLTKEGEASGWRQLFNGRDLTGWEPVTDPKGYVVRDGMLVFPSTGAGGYIRTAKDYKNFELRLDFKIGRLANSGVFLRGDRAKPDPTSSGCEVQILDDFNWEQDTGYKPQEWQFTGALYASVAPGVKALRPLGAWNTYQITYVGSRLKVELNGQVLYDVDTFQVPILHGNAPAFRDRAPSGFIGLQRHAPDKVQGDAYAWFKNIYIREIGK
ncbi:MAG: family 16 glycoside hydrolase [Acidobacteriota bacterium]